MVKIYKFIIVFFFFVNCFFDLKGQGIYQFWGATTHGGPDDLGTIFTTKTDGTGQDIKKSFAVDNPGLAYNANEPVVYNNKLYSALTYGGLHDNGIIAEYDPATGIHSKKADIFTIGGRWPGSALTLCNGKLYGVTAEGGNSFGGLIFEYDPTTHVITKKHDFIANDAAGFLPRGALTAYNNKLYGMAEKGGADNVGVIFEFDPAANTYKKCDFSANTTGNASFARLTVYDNKLWGISLYLFNGPAGGTIFSYDPAINIISPKVSLGSIGLVGHGFIDLTVLNNKLYGVGGIGANGFGAVFEYNPANNSIINKFNFTNATGKYECNLVALNNKLFGQADKGGNSDKGIIFSYDPAINEYANKVVMSKNFGHLALGSRLTVFNNKLYGWNKLGAGNNQGCFFEYNPLGNSYVKKIELGTSEVYYPKGKLVHHNNKIYGTASNTSNFNPNEKSIIYEYDIATNVYAVKFTIPKEDGYFYEQGGLIVYNNKFYGVGSFGGVNDDGVLFEFDPSNNLYTKKYNFKKQTGGRPYGKLAIYNGKLYGTCQLGNAANAGNIFEYNLLNNTYSQKVILNDNSGTQPRAGLTLYNGKFYGTTTSGGLNGMGTVFEYDPAANSFLKKADFNGVNGFDARGELTLYKNKMYGLTFWGGINSAGVLYEFDPLTAVLSKKTDLSSLSGFWPIMSTLTLYNNKLYGITSYGGIAKEGGVLFEYNPETAVYTKKTDFVATNGRLPDCAELTPVPAPTAKGIPGICSNTQPVAIGASNNKEWVAFTNPVGDAVAEVYADGNNLGNTTVNYYVHNGAVRKDGSNRFYLDRNISFNVENQPVNPVKVRLYIRKTEFETLKNTPGSGIVAPEDIGVFKNDNECADKVNGGATPIPCTVEDWGFDYVYTVAINSFSSFYFASKAYAVLPVNILSFTGKAEKKNNKLQWKASCTNDINFVIERSENGIDFIKIGAVQAAQQDCDFPFEFADTNPGKGKSYYRLVMYENNSSAKYSDIILLNHAGEFFMNIQFMPNPVEGNIATLKIESPKSQYVQLVISDMSGKQVLAKQIFVPAGISKQILDIRTLSKGAYQVTYDANGKLFVTRFIKK